MKKQIYQKYDQAEHDNKYYQCICADSELAVFGALIRRKAGLSVSYKNLFAISNWGKEDLFTKVSIKQWDGKSLKPFIPIRNAIKPSEVINKTLTVLTKQGKLVFKKGRYIKQVNGNISKP